MAAPVPYNIRIEHTAAIGVAPDQNPSEDVQAVYAHDEPVALRISQAAAHDGEIRMTQAQAEAFFLALREMMGKN